jgi:hypothetical protein
VRSAATPEVSSPGTHSSSRRRSPVGELERSAPSDVEDDIVTIRKALETIAALGEGEQVDPERVEQLVEDDTKIREARRSIDRHVAKWGIEVPST